MAEELSWCQKAKIAMIEKKISYAQISAETGLSRSYISTIINGRIYSPKAVKKISDCLGIMDSSFSTISTSS